MSKFGRIGICVFALVLLCSCSTTKEFIPQNNVQFNYNNIIDGQSRYQVTNEAVYFQKDPAFHADDVFFIDSSGEHKAVDSKNRVGMEMQIYDDSLYYLYKRSSADNEYVLLKYDLNTGSETEIVRFGGEISDSCNDFLVWDDTVFFMTMDAETAMDGYVLEAYSIGTKQWTTVAENVLQMGVSNNDVVFLSEDIKLCVVEPSETFRVIKNFSDILQSDEGIGNINFVNDGVLIKAESVHGTRWILCFADDRSAKEYTFAQDVDSVIAFEKYAYVCATNAFDEESENMSSSLYRMNLESGTMEMIEEIDGNITLFVTSDEDVYVTIDDSELWHYNADGSKEKVLL